MDASYNWAAFQLLLSGLPLTKWRELYLFRKAVGSCQITVALHEHAADQNHRIVRRGYLLHTARRLSFPAWPGDEVISRLRAGGAFANVGEIGVFRWICELHAVVAAGGVRAVHVGYVQDQRLFPEV